jgi:hypothetical protein
LEKNEWDCARVGQRTTTSLFRNGLDPTVPWQRPIRASRLRMKALRQVLLTAVLGLGCNDPSHGIVNLIDGGPNDPPICEDGGRCDGMTCGDGGACLCAISGDRAYCVDAKNPCAQLIVCPPDYPACVLEDTSTPYVGCGESGL